MGVRILSPEKRLEEKPQGGWLLAGKLPQEEEEEEEEARLRKVYILLIDIDILTTSRGTTTDFAPIINFYCL